MADLTYSEGMALIVFALLGVYVAWLGLCSNPARRWIRRMNRIAEGKRRQEAEWIASNCFREWRK